MTMHPGITPESAARLHDRTVDPRHQARRGRARPAGGAVGDSRGLGGFAELFLSLTSIPNRPSGTSSRRRWGTGPIERARMHAYAEKAMREASDGTTWTAPDDAYEAAVHEAWRPRTTIRGCGPGTSSTPHHTPAGPTQASSFSSPCWRAGRLPRHGALGGLAGRSRQPATGRLRRTHSAARIARRWSARHRRNRRGQTLDHPAGAPPASQPARLFSGYRAVRPAVRRKIT